MSRPRTKGNGPQGEILDESGNVMRTRKSMIVAAKELKGRMTSAEAVLWEKLRGKKLEGIKFYRQVAIDRFIVDFYCPRKKLVVELDGGVHDDPDQKEYDAMREAMLRSRGMRIIRLRNEEVFKNIEGACDQILDACFVKR